MNFLKWQTMIKRTLLITKDSSLRLRYGQLLIEETGPDGSLLHTVPVEDIGFLLLEHASLNITHALLQALMDNNVAVISCDKRHLPYGLMLPLYQHHAFTERFHMQVKASQPLRKQLWQQTVRAKIRNQAMLLRANGKENALLNYLAGSVKSGDAENHEGRAAAYYWRELLDDAEFVRRREGDMPNPLFNYAYAVLLAVIARALISSGLHPAFGIHHRNKYNPWCLASDIMEPYRPLVDRLVLRTMAMHPKAEALNPEIKRQLLQVPAMDVWIDEQRSPLMIAAQRTTASLAACFEGSARKLLYPEFPP